MERAGKDKKTGKAPPEEMDALTKLQAALDEGKQARDVDLTEKELEAVKGLNLLTIKPVIYACNVADEDLAEGNAFVEAIKKRSGGESVVVVSAQVESELVSLDSEDRDEFLDALGVTLEGCGLRALVRTAYDTLGLITYYTSGPTESRAWTIREGWLAPQAAGVIHGDFERGFIKAETVGYEALVDAGDEKAAKEAGLMRSEGKEYVVKDGDVMLFRFNVVESSEFLSSVGASRAGSLGTGGILGGLCTIPFRPSPGNLRGVRASPNAVDAVMRLRLRPGDEPSRLRDLEVDLLDDDGTNGRSQRARAP